ncbi:hypothetical protein HPB52_001813 [Rhipicephalus sanguineus]|uniref:Uncharacterized protein n=1 Tax=Rhipicephalus sanguineus TaxID=34632 RepID=A0A9D4T8G1_RHISA|nr:hypothetical protein HPB52_001813 [Rhipicephalus sanguineus]
MAESLEPCRSLKIVGGRSAHLSWCAVRRGDQLEQVSLEASPCAPSMLCGRSCTHESLAGRQLMCRYGDRWQLRGVAAESCDGGREQRFHHLDAPRLDWIRSTVQP